MASASQSLICPTLLRGFYISFALIRGLGLNQTAGLVADGFKPFALEAGVSEFAERKFAVGVIHRAAIDFLVSGEITIGDDRTLAAITGAAAS